MLFNSYGFIFAFLPFALAGYYLLGGRSAGWARTWLIIVSLIFYAWWRPLNVAIMAPSVALNFLLARMLLRLREEHPGKAMLVLITGIVFNLLFLGYFKYLNFTREMLNDVLGSNLVLTNIILPLGISFITFQKIAFLVDVNAGRVKAFTLREYVLFVLFFPQLIAGPIVHYREMMPQFQKASGRFSGEDFAVGVTLFSFGLVKKVFLADSIAPYVSQVYDAAAAGGHVTLIPAWLASIGFILQIYFDFSGYTDMALGLARFFGITLPMNFNSPLKAPSIIEFWLRWHATLTRFVTAYVYNPMLLSLTRRRVARGLPLIGAGTTTIGSFISLLMAPTVVTMFLLGLWHGAGYQFIIYGLLHGIYLTINHAWRQTRRQFWPDDANYHRVFAPVAHVITFVAVVLAAVFFRAATVRSAITVIAGMIGLHGTEVPQSVFVRLGHAASWLHSLGIVPVQASGSQFSLLTAWTFVLLIFALVPPNSLQMLARFRPALGFSLRPADRHGLVGLVNWAPSARWAVAVSAVTVLGILSLGHLSVFLYWKF